MHFATTKFDPLAKTKNNKYLILNPENQKEIKLQVLT